MNFPHEKREARTHGRSPGNGMTSMPLSRDPLATEGEATPGPDNYNPYDERENDLDSGAFAEQRSPTEGDDPYAFDDVEDEVGKVELPSLENNPQLNLDFDQLFDF